MTLKYIDEGPQNAPPLILLHGLTDSSRSWSLTVPHLAESYHVLVLDQRGHGDSESPRCCYAIPDFAKDVVAFMDTLNIPKATIAGHSSGGWPPMKMPLRPVDGAEARFETDQGLMLVGPAQSLAAGQRVSILLRPETFDLLEPNAAPAPGCHGISARLEQEVFSGTDYHLIVRTEPGGKVLRVTVRDAQRESLSGITPGATVHLQYPRQRLHTLRQ